MNIRTQWTRLIPTPIVLNIATLGPLGTWCIVPGTVGSFVGLFWFTLFFYNAGPLTFLLLLLASVYLAIAFCGEAEIRMGKHDPGEIILDEFVAVPICFIGTGYLMENYPMWAVLLVGFFLFRIFDVIKPFGIRKLQNLHGGLGVVVDDLAAAALTGLCIHLFFAAWKIFS